MVFCRIKLCLGTGSGIVGLSEPSLCIRAPEEKDVWVFKAVLTYRYTAVVCMNRRRKLNEQLPSTHVTQLRATIVVPYDGLAGQSPVYQPLIIESLIYVNEVARDCITASIEVCSRIRLSTWSLSTKKKQNFWPGRWRIRVFRIFHVCRVRRDMVAKYAFPTKNKSAHEAHSPRSWGSGAPRYQRSVMTIKRRSEATTTRLLNALMMLILACRLKDYAKAAVVVTDVS